MESKNDYRPFAITARCLGKPRKLYTQVLLVNLGAPRMKASYVNAMWDTGAEYSMMSKKLAERLGFEFEDKVKVQGILDGVYADYGPASVALVSNGDMVDITVVVVEESQFPEYSLILGMDFISKGTLAISTMNFETVLSFRIPSKGHIDFAKEDQEEGYTVKYLPLSSSKENDTVYQGRDVIELIMPDKMKNE